MDNARFKYLFRRWVEQTCSEEEKSELFGLIASSKHDPILRKLMDSEWEAVTDAQLSKEKADSIFGRIMMTSAKTANPAIKTLPIRIVPVWRIAAAIALLLIGGFSAFYLSGSDDSGQIGSHESAQVEETGSEHLFVKLPDGSTVLLNSGSMLDYTGSFAETREVTLTGEGYFDIVHDASRPFVVHTGNLKTTVLGTAFNIKAYAADNDITVTVTRGKVKVSDEDREIGIILPDEQITFNGKNRRSEKKAVDSQKAIAWAENDIYFNELTMAEAITQLEDRFNVQVRFENEGLKDCRFTATFMQNESIDQILEVICEFNNATFTKDQKGTIIISGDGC